MNMFPQAAERPRVLTPARGYRPTVLQRMAIGRMIRTHAPLAITIRKAGAGAGSPAGLMVTMVWQDDEGYDRNWTVSISVWGVIGY